MEKKFIKLDEVDSTNEWAKRNIHAIDHKKITFVSAKSQTHGKGRFQKEWFSPNGNIYLTICLQTTTSIPIAPIGQVLILALADLLIEKNLHPQIKWPNDLLISEKKIAGVLCETTISNHKTTASTASTASTAKTSTPAKNLFLGIGININMKDEELPPILKNKTTSLFIETKHTWDIEQFLEEFSKKASSYIEFFLEIGFYPFHKIINTLLIKNKNVKLTISNNMQTTNNTNTVATTTNNKNLDNIIFGKIDSISEEGFLTLITPTGKQNFISGELEYL